MKTSNTGKQQPITTAPRSEGAERPSQSRPEFFRLPKTGGDPYFGLGRSYYYEGEKQGYWKLIRIRQRLGHFVSVFVHAGIDDDERRSAEHDDRRQRGAV